jgi:hypothetical protein
MTKFIWSVIPQADRRLGRAKISRRKSRVCQLSSPAILKKTWIYLRKSLSLSGGKIQ